MEFGQRQDPKRRAMGLGVVVLVHIVFVYGLVNGLARKAIQLLPPPFETKILEDTTVEEEAPPPPPPPPLDVAPPPFIPPPEISITTAAPRPNAITTTDKPPPPTPPPAPRAAVPNKAPVVKAKNCREPEYPSVSERLGETGTVLLQLLVGVDGKVTDSKIEKSSGYPRLDQAAQKALSRCAFTPGEVNGQPSPAWAQLKYTFKRQD